MDKKEMSCIDCVSGSCDAKGGIFPDFCQSKSLDPAILEDAMSFYVDETFDIMEAAAEVECENYCKMTRIEEIAESAGLPYHLAGKLCNIMESDGLICIDLLGRCSIRAKNF